MEANTLQQPEFVEEIVAKVTKAMEGLRSPEQGPDEVFIVTRPNYSIQITSFNLFRTSMFIGKPQMAPVGRVVHISNRLYGPEDMKTVVFETIPEPKPVAPGETGDMLNISKSVTRHYISPIDLASKSMKATWRSDEQIVYDIVEFLINGTVPAI